MADVYKIAVEIGMQNGVSSVLRVIQRDLLGLNHTIDLTANKFSRMQTAVAGGIVALAGVGTLGAFVELAKAGGKILDQQQQMIAAGNTNVDIAREMAAAYGMVKIGGSNLSDNLKMVADLRQLLGGANLGEAIALAPTMMRAGIAAGLMTGQNSEAAAYSIAQIEDNLGWTINPLTGHLDGKRAADKAALMDAIIAGTNGRVQLADLYHFSQQARTAGRLLTDQGFEGMAPVIQAMGGYRAGTALQAFDRAFIGGVMTTRGTTWLEKLGLLNPANVHRAESGYVRLDPNAIKGSNFAAQDPQLWANTVLMPALQKAGLSTKDVIKNLLPNMNFENEDIPQMLTQILQSGLANTTNGLLAELLGNSVQNAKDVQNIDDARKQNQYSQALQSLSGAWLNFDGAFDSFCETLGLPAAQMGVTVLNDLADGIRNFDVWLGNHPGYATAIDRVLLGLGVGLTALGTTALAGALAAMIGPGGALVLTASALAGIAAAALAMPGALEAAEKALQHAVYTALHPSTWPGALTPPALPPPPGMHWKAGARGGLYVPDDPNAAASGSTIGQVIDDVNRAQDVILKAWFDWVQGGAPVTVTNPGDIANASSSATLKRIQHQMDAPPAGTTGANYRQTPSGGASNGAN